MDICIVPGLSLNKARLFVYKFHKHILLLLLNKILGMTFLSYVSMYMLNFLKISQDIFQVSLQFYILSAMYKNGINTIY